MNIQRATMPNDTAIVDPNTGRLNGAWVHYLGQLDKTTQALAAIGTLTELDSDATNSQIIAKINAIIIALNGE